MIEARDSTAYKAIWRAIFNTGMFPSTNVLLTWNTLYKKRLILAELIGKYWTVEDGTGAYLLTNTPKILARAEK